MKKKCSVIGCDNDARSRGMCTKHYMRLHRHGTAEDSGYGDKTKHPLYITWMSAKRSKVLCEEWSEFDAFLKAVGEKPGDGWRLYRKDTELPYQEGNVQWRELVFTKEKYAPDELKKVRSDAKNKKARGEHNAEAHRRKTLLKHHGITIEQYNAMHNSQNGVCAICGRPETRSAGHGKGAFPLSVDHCHETRNSGKGKGIRSLLCQACNIGLGKFDDDPELLEKAAAYLRHHKE